MLVFDGVWSALVCSDCISKGTKACSKCAAGDALLLLALAPFDVPLLICSASGVLASRGAVAACHLVNLVRQLGHVRSAVGSNPHNPLTPGSVIRRLATGAVLAPFFLFFGFRPFFVPAALASLHGQVSIESRWWQKHAHGKHFDDALPAPPLL